MNDDTQNVHTITTVGEADLGELLPLVRAYCDFYETAPPDDRLLALSRALIASPQLEGVQLLARNGEGEGEDDAVGFATVFWSWDTTEASRIGVMNDLYVAPPARGSGLADELIRACAQQCKRRGAARLDWVTAQDNTRAQAVYDRCGAVRAGWVNYSLVV
jgi:GNAT superfamily N-acetyltransferase